MVTSTSFEFKVKLGEPQVTEAWFLIVAGDVPIVLLPRTRIFTLARCAAGSETKIFKLRFVTLQLWVINVAGKNTWHPTISKVFEKVSLTVAFMDEPPDGDVFVSAIVKVNISPANMVPLLGANDLEIATPPTKKLVVAALLFRFKS